MNKYSESNRNDTDAQTLSRADRAILAVSEKDIIRFTKRLHWDDNGCLIYSGYLNECGYGHFSLNGTTVYAHRLACYLFLGELPGGGMEVDHLCFVRACASPFHLESVTSMENARRRKDRNRSQPACKRGHIKTDKNTYVNPHTGGEECRDCRTECRNATVAGPKPTRSLFRPRN